MAIDTKPNFSCRKFEQCSGDTMNLSGCTQIFGYFDMETGATLSICTNAGVGKVLTSNSIGVAGWEDPTPQGVTAVSGGSGMNFTPITSTGTVVLGTPSTITSGSTNSVGATTHCHNFNSSSFVTGTQGILVDGNNRFYLDDTYITDATLPSLYSYSGITANQSIGVLPSGQTLGMVYITNTGSTTGYYNLGTTPTGDDITPFQTISVDAGEDASVTVNMRLSLTGNTTIYVNSDDWTNAGINLQWANITYQNASTTVSPGDLPIATETQLGAIKVGTGLNIDGGGVLSIASLNAITGATNLGTGQGQLYAAEVDDQLRFKTLSGGSNITITSTANYVNIESTGGVASAANGLCVCGENITLGGALTGDTVISASTNNFLIQGAHPNSQIGYITCFGVQAAGMSTQDGGYKAGFSATSYDLLGLGIAGINASGATSSTQIDTYHNCVRACVTHNGNAAQLIMTTGATTFYDDINSKGIVYNGDYESNFTARSLATAQYVTGLTSGGSGGFLGTVTKATTEPSDLQDNQWVKPEPMSTDCFNYTFDNFQNSGGTAISVNLSLCDSYLRYCCTGATGGYWIDESYCKPLSSGYTWVGNDNCKAAEVAVVNEWVDSPSDINYTGQKYSYPTQTVFQVDVGTCVTIPNKILIETIDLGTVANHCIFTIPAGCCALVSNAKLIMLQTANPDSVSVSIGNNACNEIPSQSYWNMVCTCQIDDVTLRDVYDLLSPTVPTGAAICNGACCGADVYFRVQSGATGTLCAHLLFEGYIF